jgi:acyl carrier protein
MDAFLEKIAEILEVNEIKEADVLADFPEWDSLSVLSVIAMVDSDYHVNLTGTEVRESLTGQALRELVIRKRSK